MRWLKKQVIISTQSVELLNEFDVEDVVVVNKDSNGATSFRRLDEESLKIWLDDYSLGDLWQKNILVKLSTFTAAEKI